MTARIAVAAALAVGLGLPVFAQRRPPIASGKPKVELVDTVGCVEEKTGTPATWWLTSAVPPKATTNGFVTAKDVDSAKSLPLGSNSFLLIGTVDFLDADALVKDPERSKFTTPATANGTGQLKAGRKVLVKGLLLDTDGQKRINLTQVISLADVCGA